VEAADPSLPIRLSTWTGRPLSWIPSRAYLWAARVGFHRETAWRRHDHPTVSACADKGTYDGTASLAIHLASPSARRVALQSAALFARSRRKECEGKRVSEVGFGRRVSVFVCRECQATVGSWLTAMIKWVGAATQAGGALSRPRPKLQPAARERAVCKQAGPCWAASPEWAE
jgi:hypothetical protein